MEPQIEHTFYTWLIVFAAVTIATTIGGMIDRLRCLATRRTR